MAETKPEIIEIKQVKRFGSGAHVIVPKRWRQDYVKVVRLPEEGDD